MENNYLIYSITSPSNKIYIGVTNNFTRRMNEHKSDWQNRQQKIALHNSFNKYGFDEHIKEILFSGLCKEEAYKLEFELIIKFDTINSKIGLNSRTGGLGGNCIDWKSDIGILINKKIQKTKLENYHKKWDKLKPIILSLKDTHTIDEISIIINKSRTSLCKYLKKTNIKIPIKSKYNLDEIALTIKPLIEKGLTNKEIIKLTGYSNGTFCRAKRKLDQIKNK
jgi:predicted GIY-YIG superfamily endonuclease